MYKIPEISIDLEEINKNKSIPLEEEEFKKKLRYPLNYAVFETEVGKIKERWCEIVF